MLSPILGFVPNTVNADNLNGSVSITGATLANIGTYNMVLQASVDAQIITYNFDVIILDPCKFSTFDNPSSLVDMVITMPSAGPTT
jgi:hypothetical protein